MPAIRLNFLTALLVLLTVTVQVGAIWAAADPLQEVDKPAPVETSENEPATAVPIFILVIAELIVVYALWLIYRLLPALLQRWIKRACLTGGVLYALLYAISILPALLVAYAGIIIAYALDYKWLAYDIGALVLAIVVAATLGGYFGPLPLIVLVAGLMIYDWVAVVETTLMSRVAKLMGNLRLPVLFVIPNRLDFDIGAFLDELSANGVDLDSVFRDQLHLAIGVGDFAIPAALTAAVFRFYGVAIAFAVLFGTVVGLLGLMGAKDDEALPGLPWLGGGALGGFAVSMLVVTFVG